MAKDKTIEERDQHLKDRWVERMEGDFIPGYTPERTPKVEDRMAFAAEYAAYQLGQINKRMGRLIELLEKAAPKT